jgi:hypothetical protein
MKHGRRAVRKMETKTMSEVSNKPPYTITEKAADYLAKIVEIVTRLEFGTEFKRDLNDHRLKPMGCGCD